jgi:hypothetical protein
VSKALTGDASTFFSLRFLNRGPFGAGGVRC